MNAHAGERWFALHVRSKCEATVSTLLRGKGFEPLLPTYKAQRRWSDRIRELDVPLFPGYLFCRFDPLHRLPILVTPGLIQIVGIGKNPVPVDDCEIHAIEALAQSGLPRQPWPYLKVGQRARVEFGPLRGQEGILVDFKGQRRIVMSVTLLQRSVAAEVDADCVLPIGEPVPGIGRSPLPHRTELPAVQA